MNSSTPRGPFAHLKSEQEKMQYITPNKVTEDPAAKPHEGNYQKASENACNTLIEADGDRSSITSSISGKWTVVSQVCWRRAEGCAQLLSWPRPSLPHHQRHDIDTLSDKKPETILQDFIVQVGAFLASAWCLCDWELGRLLLDLGQAPSRSKSITSMGNSCSVAWEGEPLLSAFRRRRRLCTEVLTHSEAKMCNSCNSRNRLLSLRMWRTCATQLRLSTRCSGSTKDHTSQTGYEMIEVCDSSFPGSRFITASSLTF
ncbi:hypothetical protein EI94DRAFT_915694 [Lactarius quietus]|nr:hypothetical protein EI94DRAFT_915694 [Lactarius quietus]